MTMEKTPALSAADATQAAQAAGAARAAPARPAKDVDAEAAAWLAARDSGAWTPVQQQALDAWLADATAHRIAFLRLEHTWQRADRLQVLQADPRAAATAALASASASSTPTVAETPRRAPWWRPWAPARAGRHWDDRRSPVRGAAAMAGYALAAAIALAALFTAGGPGLPWRPGQPHATALGERAVLALADGSRLTLNTATRVRTDIAGRERRVWLDSGEAYFDIAHDPGRPFVVTAGSQRVTVVGTRFALRRDGDRLRVRVLEGKVQVTAASGATALLSASDAADATADAVRLRHESPQEMDARMGWLQGQLRLDGLSLAEAAAEFNRYNRRQLRILDARAAETRIGGTFDARNVDGFARLLHSGFGLDVRIREDAIEVGRAD